jgi:iron(III) transport system permease protein
VQDLGLSGGRTWRRLGLALGLLTLLPLGVVLSFGAGEGPRYFGGIEMLQLAVRSLGLAAAVGLGCMALGVSLAWLVVFHRFPGRGFFAWGLVLPLALPAYVLGFVKIGLWDYAGPIRSALRGAGLDAWSPEIRSTGGLLLVLVLAFYPYVYLTARNAFESQGRRLMEAALGLGLSERQAWLRAALPAARPWILGGTMLAMMETMADFGTVSIFNVQTLSTAVYKAWYGFFSLGDAARLAAVLMLLALLLGLAEQASRRRQRFGGLGRGESQAPPRPLRGAAAWGATAACAGVFGLAFGLPLLQLLDWSRSESWLSWARLYAGPLRDSLVLSTLAALVVTAAGGALAMAGRYRRGGLSLLALRCADLGYALPGAVLAIGFYIPVAWLDQHWLGLAARLGWSDPWLLRGTPLIMLLGYTVRFVVLARQPLASSLERLRPGLDETARSLGASSAGILSRIHLPLLRGGLAVAALLVFVETLKEMPITLMTRPLGRDTLAVKVFELTTEGLWERAAVPSLLLLLAGLLPVLWLARGSAGADGRGA